MSLICIRLDHTKQTVSGFLAQFVKGYSMPAIGHRNVTVPPRVWAGVE